MAEALVDIFEGVEDDEVSLLRMERLCEIRNTRIHFATKCHQNTHGEPMDFTHFPHIRELYETLAPEICIQGSVQSFKTEWAIIDHFAAAYNGMSIFFVLPKYEMRNTFVQNRVDRIVNVVPEYKKIIGNSFFDNVAMKNFGKGVIKYVGSNVLADFREFPADMIVVEEADECNRDNVRFALDRLRASKFQFKRYLGNPKIKGRGINAFYQESDQREWHVPCESCRRLHVMDWFETIVLEHTDSEGKPINYTLRDTDWYSGCGRDLFPICPDCGGRLIRDSGDGQWVATAPKNKLVGYHFSMQCSPINSLSGMWMRFQEAQSDPMKLQHFYNSDLGEPFSPKGNKLTEEALDSCVGDYEFQIDEHSGYIKGHKHAGPCSMGVDVGSVLDVRISAPGNLGKRKTLFIGKVRTTDDLYDLIDRYHVEKCVIDSGPESTMVQEFQQECARRGQCDVWLCRYHPQEGSDKRMSYDASNHVILIDRTSALDRSFGRITSGKTELPKNYATLIKGEFVKEMLGPVRQIVEDTKGNSRFEWTKCKDHQRHADVYDMLAADMMVESVIADIVVG